MMKLFQSGKANQARQVMCHNKFPSRYSSQLYYLFSPCRAGLFEANKITQD